MGSTHLITTAGLVGLMLLSAVSAQANPPYRSPSTPAERRQGKQILHEMANADRHQQWVSQSKGAPKWRHAAYVRTKTSVPFVTKAIDPVETAEILTKNESILAREAKGKPKVVEIKRTSLDMRDGSFYKLHGEKVLTFKELIKVYTQEKGVRDHITQPAGELRHDVHVFPVDE